MTVPVAAQGAAVPPWADVLQQVFEERWRIRPAFQPIVDVEQQRLRGFQMLARFISPRRAAPPEWFDAAEHAGVRARLERRLLDLGLRAVAQLPERCRLLLPVSPATLLDEATQKLLARNFPIARRVVLDLGRENADTCLPELSEALELFRADGGRIAVGADGSPGGLDALPRLRPDLLKVGPDFVAGLEADAARRAVVEALAQLVGALGGRVLAVGVEERCQVDVLRAAGITLMQGFALGRPVPTMAEQVTRERVRSSAHALGA